MQFRTELPQNSLELGITHNDKIMLLGSCFTEHISSSLSRYRFPVFANSHGIIFHPIPLAKALSDTNENISYESEDLIESNGKWISLNHHGKYSSENKIEALQNINASIKEGAKFLKEASILIVTFGTAIGYYHQNTGSIVANCHKLNAKLFEKKRSEISEISEPWKKLLVEIFEVNPSLKVIFTISPVRHLREGFQENQLSKSALFMAIDDIRKSFVDRCCYFPSYEIMMDDLRDYRFYEVDMVHPNAQAIEYIREKFFNAVLSPSALQKCGEMESLLKKIEHRSIHETPEQKERRIADANEAIRHILLKT
ncbi:MAG: hypothetical protein RL204_2461 [Bacteroidota bacterium]|jgi:hypothetical protein